VLFWSIHALILGSLAIDEYPGMIYEFNTPFVLLSNIVVLAEVDEVRHWFGGKQLKAIYNIDLATD
jgi:hypothetical protein